MESQRYTVWHPAGVNTLPWFIADGNSPRGHRAIARFRDEVLAHKVARRLNREVSAAGAWSVPDEATKLLTEAAAAIGAARRLIRRTYNPPRIGSVAHAMTLSGVESVLKILARVLREDLKSQTLRTCALTAEDNDDEHVGDDDERT